MASDAIQALEKLTLRDDLSLLTIRNFSDFLHSRKLLRLHKAWCPLCYSEWNDSKKTIYEPLLWCFQMIQICSVHKHTLLECCPSCNATSFPLTWFSRPGYCPKCKSWLGSNILINQDFKCQSDIADQLEWQFCTVTNIGQLLSNNLPEKDVNYNNNIKRNLRLLLTQLADGNLSKFCSLFRLSYARLHSYFAGVNMLSFEAILEICFALKIEPSSLIFSEMPETIKNTSIVINKLDEKHKSNSTKFTPEFLTSIEDELKKILTSPERPPSTEVMNSILPISYPNLLKYFPNYCDAITKRRATYPTVRMIAYRLEEVRLYLRGILSDNAEPPSINMIAMKLDTSKPILEEYFPDLCSLINSRRSNNILPYIIEEPKDLELYLKGLLASRDCPPSLADICQRFRVSESILLEEFSALMTDIFLRRSQHPRAAEIDKNHRVLLLLKEELNKPENEACSIREFCKIHGLYSQTLEKNFPEEYKGLVMRSKYIRSLRVAENMFQMTREINQAVILLNSKGIYPAINEVKKHMSKPRFVMDSRFIHVWENALRESGIPIDKN